MLVCTVGVTVIPLLTLEPVHVGVVQAHTTLVAKRQIYSMPNPLCPYIPPRDAASNVAQTGWMTVLARVYKESIV